MKIKIKIGIMIFLITIAFSCQERTEKNVSFEKIADREKTEEINSNEEKVVKRDNFETPQIEVIAAELPIKLELIDFEDRDLVRQISDGKMSGITEEIRNFYLEKCEGSYYSMKDVYLETIQIHNTSNYILYWIIFKHISGKVNSKILFFDNIKKEFSKYVHDLNIHALYNEKDRKLTPTNLKKRFKIDFPEIEIANFDKDKFPDFKLRRLYHNGTENAIEEMIIEVNQTKADTLKFEKEWIRN